MQNWFVRFAMRQLADHDENGNPQWQETPEKNPASWTSINSDDKELPSDAQIDNAKKPHNITENSVLWHGSASNDETQHSADGLHVGTYHAAKKALTNVVGHKADGTDWDGTTAYGETPVMGQNSLYKNGYIDRVSGNLPEEDYLPKDKPFDPDFDSTMYSGSNIDHSWKPSLFPVKLTQPLHPHVVGDTTANNTMNDHAYATHQFQTGRNPRDPGQIPGMAYLNGAEDRGSLSVVVPHHSYVERLDPNTVKKPEYRHNGNDQYGPILQQSIDQLKADVAAKPKGNPWSKNVWSAVNNSGETMGSMEKNIRKNMEVAKEQQAKIQQVLPAKPLPKTSNWFVRNAAQWNHDAPDKQLSFSIDKTEPTHQYPGYDRINAFVNNQHAGHMILAPQRVTPDSPHGPGEIADIQTHQNFRGQGLAREMAYHAQENDLWPKHSDTRTPDGDAFAKATPELGFTRKRSFFVRSKEHTSGMVALIPSNTTELTVEGGDPATQIHMTLVHLGESDDWNDESRTALKRFVRQNLKGEFGGKIFAHSEFNPDDKQCSTYLVSDLDESLIAIKDKIVEEFDKIPEQHTPWIPHITAGFDLDVSKLNFTGPIHFDTVRIAFAGENYDFPLNTKTASIDPEDEEWENEGGKTSQKISNRSSAVSITDTPFYIRIAGDMTSPHFVRTTPSGNQLSSVPNTGADLTGDEEVASPFLNKDEEHSGDPEDSGYRARAEWAGFHPMQDEPLPQNWDGKQLS